MLIRRPSVYDIAKAVALLSPDQKIQDDLIADWVIKQNNSTENGFFSYVVLAPGKEVVGFVTGTNKDRNITINTLFGVDIEISKELLCTVIKKQDPNAMTAIAIKTDAFEACGFFPTSLNMGWVKEIKDDSKDSRPSDTEEVGNLAVQQPAGGSE